MLTRVMRRISAVISLLLIATATPASAAPNYVYPIEGCKSSYSRAHHDYPATDILAKTGCKFLAPTSGVIDEVNDVDKYSWKNNNGALRGGLSLSIIGDDGVRYYGSHFSKIYKKVIPGYRVEVGELIALVGTSGDAAGTAPHVHFGISWPTESGIWWVRRGMVYPWKYLDAWKAGKDLSPTKEVAKKLRKVGEVPKRVGY
jgi:murein DD-endopeptidase MepM/ murein hydrolase activator NlpD